MTRYLLALLLFAVCACGQSESEGQSFSEWPYFNIDGEFQLLKLDHRTSQESKCVRHFEDEFNNEFLFLLNSQTNSVHKFDLNSGEQVAVYEFEVQGPEGVGRLEGFDLIGNNRLVLISEVDYRVSIATVEQANEVKVVQSIRLLGGGKDIRFTPLVNSNSRIIEKNGKVFFTAVPFIDPVQNSAYKAGKSLISLNLADSTIEELNTYTEKYLGRWPSYYSYPSTAYNIQAEKLITSLPGEEQLIAFNPDQISSKSYYRAKPAYFEKGDLKPLTDEVRTDQGASKFVTQNSSYGRILFDSYRNVYYRFTEYPYGESIERRGLSYRGRINGVIILDQNFNIIKEVEKLTPNPVNMAFVGKKGLYIKQSMKGEEDVLRYRVINFEL